MKRGRFSSWSLHRKILVSMLGCTLLAMVLSSLFIYGRAVKETVRLNERYLEQNVDRTAQLMEQTVSGTMMEAFSCLNQPDCLELILDDAQRFEEAPEDIYNRLQTELSRIVKESNFIGAVTLLKKNGSMISATASSEWTLISSQEEIFRMIETAEEPEIKSLSTGGWVLPHRVPVEGGGEKVFLLSIRNLRSRQTNENTVTVVAYMEEVDLRPSYSWYGKESMIVSEGGTILSSVDEEKIGLPVNELPNVCFTNENGQMVTQMTVGDRAVATAKLPSLGSYLVILQDAEPLAVTTGGLLTTLIIVMVVGVLFSIIMSSVMSRMLIRPVEALKDCMSQAREGDLTVRFRHSSTDEISWLGESYNLLLDEIERKISDIQSHELQLRQMELRMLQAQINPHLLYNSLDTIHYLMTEGRTEDAGEALQAMSGFFKISLSKGAFRIPIREEIRHIELYMKVQRICRRKSVTLEVDCEEELLNHSIIKLTLQPIIENAYLYAFVGAFEDGTIRLQLYRQGEDLFMTITDDGMGMSDRELRRLQQDLKAPNCRSGFGLWNVNQRFQNCYGEQYGLSVDSELGSHTTITVRLPWEEAQWHIEC